jgi:hypothetical protein
MASSPESPISAAQAVAQVRAVRLALLDLHKVILDAERTRYEQSRGRIDTPHQALQLIMGDPFFAWLRPLSQLIVGFDEWLADERARQSRAAAALMADVRRLLAGDEQTNLFSVEYRRALQYSPDVVMTHARTMGLVEGR